MLLFSCPHFLRNSHIDPKGYNTGAGNFTVDKNDPGFGATVRFFVVLYLPLLMAIHCRMPSVILPPTRHSVSQLSSTPTLQVFSVRSCGITLRHSMRHSRRFLSHWIALPLCCHLEAKRWVPWCVLVNIIWGVVLFIFSDNAYVGSFKKDHKQCVTYSWAAYRVNKRVMLRRRGPV